MRPLLRFMAGMAAAGTATLAYASLVERNLFALRRAEVPVLEPGSRPLRILHISDAHFTPGQRHKQRWISGLDETDPDLVVLTGDSLADVDAVGITLQAYQPLLRRPGAFVLGSNDYTGPVFKNPLSYFGKHSDPAGGATLPTGELRDALTGAGWADLNNARSTVKIGDRMADMIGVDDPHIGLDDYPRARRGAEPSPGVDVRIGLTHSPEPAVLDAMAADGYQLLLAGHTHGGQVCVPGYGALLTNCGLPRRMAKGLHRWDGSGAYLHVSAGIGTHPTMPIRFACRPEASLLTLVAR